MSLEFTDGGFLSLELTDDDRLILEGQRLERFRSFFYETISFCFLQLDSKNELVIHCSEPWLVDQLLCEIDQLCWYAWVIVGVSSLSIYFAQEEICRAKTQKRSKRTTPFRRVRVK